MTREWTTAVVLFLAPLWVGGACSPAVDDATGGRAASGALADEGIILDWVSHDPWDGGHCLDVRFTNTGEAASDWRFDVRMDATIADVSYAGELPGLLSTSGATATFAPVGSPTLAAYDVVETSLCLEPATVPEALDASVTRAGGPDGGEPPLFGTLRDPSGQLLLTWDERGASIDDDCVELTVGNLGDVAFTRWSVVLSFGTDVTLTGSDGRFFALDDTPGTLDLRPTAATLAIPAHGTVRGEVCFAPLVEPTALAAVLELDPEPARALPPPAHRPLPPTATRR